MQSRLRLACSTSVMKRALKYALVVGFVLIAINHGDAILDGEVTAGRLMKMILTVFVPYAVSTSSSVSAMRERAGEGSEGPG